jgi:hypothetical protein
MIIQNIAQLLAHHTASHPGDSNIQIGGMRILKKANKSAEADILLTNLSIDPHSKHCTVVILRFSSDPHIRCLCIGLTSPAPPNTFLLRMPQVPQLVKNISTFLGTQRFIKACAKACQLPLS